MGAIENLTKQIEIETPVPVAPAEMHDAITREEIAKMVEDGIKDLKPDLQKLVIDLIEKNTSVKADPLADVDKEAKEEKPKEEE
jgi:hypothetical protein